MWKFHLFENRHFIAPSEANGRGRPFAHTIHRQKRSLFEGRWEKGARGMCLVMLGEQHRNLGPQPRDLVAEGAGKIELFPQPPRQRTREGEPSARRHRKIGLQHPGELDDRLVIKDNGIQIRFGEARLFQAKRNGMPGKTFVVFLPAETFLLRGGDDVPVTQKRRRGVMVIGGDAENVPHVRGCYRNGYIRGASTEPPVNTITAANKRRSRTSGINHHFFSSRRKTMNSLKSLHMIATSYQIVMPSGGSCRRRTTQWPRCRWPS